jgi:hypothetical protein
MKVEINRRRIAHTDDPSEVYIDGRNHSLSFATDIIIMEAVPSVKRYVYYDWDYRGIFRATKGPFKWFFNWEIEKPDYSDQRFVYVEFAKTIDYEKDDIREIEAELRDRLTMIVKALENYKEPDAVRCRNPLEDPKMILDLRPK